ncbi:1968_t:CDS:2 [Acaulospora morrowiae]|uniref:1968_t:CDS:1 n=1 Tax=Acaulospora morrowiae TaxID=94023 RepID=A0A9N9EHH5_9GLOM|nr:1968_t:CDS:2 [Acaulospora morrowiae]
MLYAKKYLQTVITKIDYLQIPVIGSASSEEGGASHQNSGIGKKFVQNGNADTLFVGV